MEAEFEQLQQGDKFSTRFEPKRGNPFTRPAPVILFILCCILGLGNVGLTWYVYQVQNHELSNTQSQLQQTKNDLANVVKKNENDLSRLNTMANEFAISQFDHSIEGGAVTDNFYVNKADFEIDDSKSTLLGFIDVETQPALSYKYKGQGSFDVPDRELKGMMTDILEKVGENYTSYFKDAGYPKWEDGQITVTIKNYEIGKYSKGTFTLKGE